MDDWRTISAGRLLQHVHQQNTNIPVSDFDPYQMFLKRKNGESSPIPEPVQYNVEDVKVLEEFCAKYNIMGFNFGRMNPRVALNMLKAKMGVVETTPKAPATKQLLNG